MIIKKRVPKKTVQDLVLFNQSRFYTHFEVSNFQRKYRKFFKFRILSDKLFFLTSKITLHSIKVEVVDTNRYKLTYTNFDGSFEVSAASSRCLVEKMVKHQIY